MYDTFLMLAICIHLDDCNFRVISDVDSIVSSAGCLRLSVVCIYCILQSATPLII